MDTLSFTTKKQLAMAYSPGCSYDTAKRRLQRWISRSDIMRELISVGYDKNRQKLTQNEIKIIIEHLGEP